MTVELERSGPEEGLEQSVKHNGRLIEIDPQDDHGFWIVQVLVLEVKGVCSGRLIWVKTISVRIRE